MFSTNPKTNFNFFVPFILSSASALNLDQSKIFVTLPNNKILDVTKVKGDKNIDKMTISLVDQVENTEGKVENAGYKHFFLIPQCFSKAFLFGVVESQNSVVKS